MDMIMAASMAVDWVSGEPILGWGSGECQPRVLFFTPPAYRWLLSLIAYDFTFFEVPRFFAEFMNRRVTLNHRDLTGRHRK